MSNKSLRKNSSDHFLTMNPTTKIARNKYSHSNWEEFVCPECGSIREYEKPYQVAERSAPLSFFATLKLYCIENFSLRKSLQQFVRDNI